MILIVIFYYLKIQKRFKTKGTIFNAFIEKDYK